MSIAGLGAEAAAVLAGGVLMAAGVNKAAAPSDVCAALREVALRVGVFWRVPRWAGRGLGAVEVAVSVWCVVGGGPIAAVAVVALAAGFALAGAVVVATGGARVECGCFGGLVGSLGSAQIWAFPVWVLVAVGVGRQRGVLGMGINARLAVLAVCCAAAAVAAVARRSAATRVR